MVGDHQTDHQTTRPPDSWVIQDFVHSHFLPELCPCPSTCSCPCPSTCSCPCPSPACPCLSQRLPLSIPCLSLSVPSLPLSVPSLPLSVSAPVLVRPLPVLFHLLPDPVPVLPVPLSVPSLSLSVPSLSLSVPSLSHPSYWLVHSKPLPILYQTWPPSPLDGYGTLIPLIIHLYTVYLTSTLSQPFTSYYSRGDAEIKLEIKSQMQVG